MSHITGTVQTLGSPVNLGPDFGAATDPPDTWTHNFPNTAPPIGVTKLVMIHFQNVSLPGSNRLEVDLGYDTDVFTAADGPQFWTRPANVYVLPGGLVPIRYIRDGGGGTGGVQIDKYGRGEQHAGKYNMSAQSNCDPFFEDVSYQEPIYDPFWYCTDPPNWENIARVTSAADIRAKVSRSIGMIISVEGNDLSTCSVTLVDSDKVLTAGHCHTPDEALTSSITFDYQTDEDGNRLPGYNPRFYKVKASLEHRYDGPFIGTHDYSLLQLAESPPGIPAIQMRHDLPVVGEQVFGVHHPNGAVKKLSLPHPGFDTVLGSSAGAITVHSNFHVSGGSSGSGLFDAAGRIVGVLSIGDPCGNTGSPSPLNYFPTSTIFSEIAPAPPTPVTRDVMVVFDRSGSMSETDGAGRIKIEAARDALSLFIRLVRSGVGNRLGLVSFSTSASDPPDFSIADVTGGNKNTLTGPSPFSTGIVGDLDPDGATSIGDGLDTARMEFPAPGSNPRAILLMTDGMENTYPFIDDVDDSLSEIDIHAIGFGSDSNLNGDLLNNLATSHNGFYTRAESGLALEKFFTQAFGNIFEAGVLFDPEYDLKENQRAGKTEKVFVCGEDTITIVVGWDRTDASLLIEVRTPGGASVTAVSPGVELSSGRTWTYFRIPLPQGGERDGVWSVTPVRPGGGSSEFPPPAPQLRYFISVVPTGGPRLICAPSRIRYTGDLINPLIMLRYPDGSWPGEATVEVTLSRPNAGIGNILTEQKQLRPPVSIGGDTIPSRQATLAALEQEAGHPLITYTNEVHKLFDDPQNTNGAFEDAAAFGNVLKEKLQMEGNYRFHFRATYGEGCTATRELNWSVHVDVGIDPSQTTVTTTDTGTRPDGTHGVIITLTPRDKYGNYLGPGRGDSISVSGTPGTTVTGPPQDNGDGSYTVTGVWDPGSGQGPGVVVGQPGRPGVVVQEPPRDCSKWKLLVWLLLILLLILLILLLYCWFK